MDAAFITNESEFKERIKASLARIVEHILNQPVTIRYETTTIVLETAIIEGVNNGFFAARYDPTRKVLRIFEEGASSPRYTIPDRLLSQPFEPTECPECGNFALSVELKDGGRRITCVEGKEFHEIVVK